MAWNRLLYLSENQEELKTHTQSISHAQTPLTLTDARSRLEEFDAVWIVAPHGRDASSMEVQTLLESLDWHLRGQLQKILNEKDRKPFIVVPTMGKLKTANVILEDGTIVSTSKFRLVCKGVKARTVLVLNLGPQKITRKSLERGEGEYPDQVEISPLSGAESSL